MGSFIWFDQHQAAWVKSITELLASSNSLVILLFFILGLFASRVVLSPVFILLKRVNQQLSKLLGLHGRSNIFNKSKTITHIHATVNVSHQYPIMFENNVFELANPVLYNLLTKLLPGRQKIFIYLDSGVDSSNRQLRPQIHTFFEFHKEEFDLVALPKIINGGETAKQHSQIDRMYHDMLHHQLDRHSCVIAIGGGALIDAVGLACATFRRGVKLIRLPSTVSAQNNTGVSIENGYNWSNIKNLIGTFSPPIAVMNDISLLNSLPERDRLSGFAETIKVAVTKDKSFFKWLEESANLLNNFDKKTCQYAIARCAQLNVEQISCSGNIFENGSYHPIDYGHWSAHKLESLTSFNIRHGEAIAIGMAIDARYAVGIGLLTDDDANRLINLLEQLGFTLWHNALSQRNQYGQLLIHSGLDEFRQHIGGDLCITLLSGIGKAIDVHEIKEQELIEVVHWLKQRASQALNNSVNTSALECQTNSY